MELFDKEKVKTIIIHCSDTRADMSIDADVVRFWHRSRGFEDIGYHYLIQPNGNILIGRSLAYVGAHAVGYNKTSIGVMYVGGRDSQWRLADTRTYAQKISIIYSFLDILRYYPNIENVIGHNDVSVKSCPCFDAAAEYKNVIQHLKNY